MASIDQMPVSQLSTFVRQVAALKVDYGLTQDEKDTVLREALVLTRKYFATWQEYTRLR